MAGLGRRKRRLGCSEGFHLRLKGLQGDPAGRLEEGSLIAGTCFASRPHSGGLVGRAQQQQPCMLTGRDWRKAGAHHGAGIPPPSPQQQMLWEPLIDTHTALEDTTGASTSPQEELLSVTGPCSLEGLQVTNDPTWKGGSWLPHRTHHVMSSHLEPPAPYMTIPLGISAICTMKITVDQGTQMHL
ncbi:hypothetical protein NDU88_008158 [Pleurodeles waltl]|uniref:Uncharacterized protein n=1 Tax=Pleurodeles waltl TaxID=8319 RepID=A0AAV7QTV8_PLEWA|nr:hypothetical protein NDU88_008158 [Pleurodeles waltl]